MVHSAANTGEQSPPPASTPLFTPLTKGPHGMHRQVMAAFRRAGRLPDFDGLTSKTSACITVYNEGGEQLETTLKRGVCENMAAMNERKDDLGSLDVHIVVDGLAKMSDSMMETLERLQLFDRTLCGVKRFEGKDVKAYYFFNTIELKQSEVATEGQRYPKMNVHVIVKRHNMQKLNSHFWFFRGCCKISSIMDKTMESIFGYVPCLPGAFSAYPIEAIERSPWVFPTPHIKVHNNRRDGAIPCRFCAG